MENMIQHSQENLNKFAGAGREQFEKASQQAMKSAEDFQKLAKDNWDAYVASATVVAKGVEQMGKAWVAFTQETMEKSANAAKALMGAKTLREAAEMQGEFARASFDKFVAESTKLSETGVKVANEAMEPITARINVTMEKAFKPLAA